jgi:hypothetical protein
MKLNGLKMFVACTVLMFAGGYITKACSLDDATQTGLQQVRDKLRANGCDKFIIVQALMDGVLKENEPYNFVYSGKEVKLNDVVLAEPYNTTYTTLLREFFKEKHPKGNMVRYSVSTTGTDFSVAMVMKPAYSAESCNCDKSEQVVIVDDRRGRERSTPGVSKKPANQQTTITYSKDGITVNGRKLSADEEKVYKYLYFSKFTEAPEGKATISVSGNGR